MAGVRVVALVGARSLPVQWASRVASIVSWLLGRGFGIATGGARGTGEYTLRALVLSRNGACVRSMAFLPWPVEHMPGSVRGLLRRFAALGGRVDTVLADRPSSPGAVMGALRRRTSALVDASCGLVAFLHGPSRGTGHEIRLAIRRGLPVVAFVADGAMLPSLAGGRWVAVDTGPLAGAVRWVPDPPEPECSLLELREIMSVPSTTGMPVHDTLTHIAALSQGDRLWFEQCEVVGDKIVAPHENVSDGRPAFLGVPALRKRFGCDPATAVELGELFFALDADETVVGSYQGEAHRWGLDTVRRELFRLVVGLAELEQADDVLDDAEPFIEEPDDDDMPTSPSVAYHVVGYLGPEPEEPDWMAKQPTWFRALLARIESCPSLEALATLGQEVYAMPLAHDQAGVAWTWYRLRKARLQATQPLSPQAWRLLLQLQRVPEHALPRFGTHLYRLQHNGLASLPSHEWAALWQAYKARKAALAS